MLPRRPNLDRNHHDATHAWVIVQHPKRSTFPCSVLCAFNNPLSSTIADLGLQRRRIVQPAIAARLLSSAGGYAEETEAKPGVGIIVLASRTRASERLLSVRKLDIGRI